MNYKEIYSDHSYLWAIGPASDMTGGYVDQDDLDLLLKTPTKTTAKTCLLEQMDYWFKVGIDDYRSETISPRELEDKHPRIKKIAKKYGFDY